MKQIDLIDNVPNAGKGIGLLLQTTLENTTLLLFHLMIDQYDWINTVTSAD